jgi:hypothetical protein
LFAGGSNASQGFKSNAEVRGRERRRNVLRAPLLA